MRARPSVLESFNYAFEGIIHVLRTQRNMRIHFAIAFGVLVAAFAGWMAATYVAGADHRFLISSIALIMALLVAQTRVESGIHSAIEVTYGALVGALATLAVFQVFS